MGPLGMQELVIIFVVALVIFGPRKLPELGRSLGKSLSEFKRASNELRSTLDDEIRIEDRKEKAAAKPATSTSASPSPKDAPPAEGHSIATPVEPETVARGEQGA